MSAGKVTVVQCLSQPLRRQVGREVAARVQYRGRGTASDQQSDARTHRHSAIQAYTQMAKQTRTKELKEKRGYLEIGWGTQPQHHPLKFWILKQGLWATVCKTVRPMLTDRCLSVLFVCSVCDVSVLWPNGWMDQDETWHAGTPRPCMATLR